MIWLKLILGYGKCGEDVTRHVRTVVVQDEKKFIKLIEKPLFVSEQEFLDEDENFTAWELKMKKRRIIDDKPIVFSVAILQHSKLLFMRYKN